jgi:hypothetical protein
LAAAVSQRRFACCVIPSLWADDCLSAQIRHKPFARNQRYILDFVGLVWAVFVLNSNLHIQIYEISWFV